LADAEALHQEIKALIVETLMLEEVTADEIDTDAPLFVEGLGLDSIDSLELAMELEERYGVTLEEDPEQNQAIFQSVRSLATFVMESRQV
jgi:acyl carrier protein